MSERELQRIEVLSRVTERPMSVDGIAGDVTQMDGGGRHLVVAQTSSDIPPAEIAPRYFEAAAR